MHIVSDVSMSPCLNVWCLVSVVWCLMSQCPSVYVWCLVFGVWCLVSGLWCPTSRCLVSRVKCPSAFVWCLVFGVWCLVSDVPTFVSMSMSGVAFLPPPNSLLQSLACAQIHTNTAMFVPPLPPLISFPSSITSFPITNIDFNITLWWQMP